MYTRGKFKVIFKAVNCCQTVLPRITHRLKTSIWWWQFSKAASTGTQVFERTQSMLCFWWCCHWNRTEHITFDQRLTCCMTLYLVLTVGRPSSSWKERFHTTSSQTTSLQNGLKYIYKMVCFQQEALILTMTQGWGQHNQVHRAIIFLSQRTATIGTGISVYDVEKQGFSPKTAWNLQTPSVQKK